LKAEPSGDILRDLIPYLSIIRVLKLVINRAKHGSKPVIPFRSLCLEAGINSILKPIAVRAYGYVTPDREGVRYPSPRGVKTEEIIGDTKIIGELLGYRLLVKVLVSDYDTLPSHPERQLYTGIPRRSHPRQIHVVAFPQYGIKPLFRPSVIYGLNVCQRIDRKTLVLILGQLV
jgi:hypothetical protein